MPVTLVVRDGPPGLPDGVTAAGDGRQQGLEQQARPAAEASGLSIAFARDSANGVVVNCASADAREGQEA